MKQALTVVALCLTLLISVGMACGTALLIHRDHCRLVRDTLPLPSGAHLILDQAKPVLNEKEP